MNKRFKIEVDENRDVRILDNGIDIGQFRLCNLLNELYEENKALKIKYEGFSDEDFSDYLKTCHKG